MPTSPSSTWALVRTPVLITLGVTALRLLGRPRRPAGFPREPGGRRYRRHHRDRLAVAPIFAFWFGQATRPLRKHRIRQRRCKTNFVYGIGARIPVILIMLFATLGDWGTHYDAYPPDMEATMGLMGQWFWGGFVPQVLFWLVFWTTLLGGLITWLTAKFSARSA